MELEFYFPKTKSKHKCVPTTGKVYPSKGGTIRYGVQATMNGSKSLPKYITEQEFNRLGFGAESFEASVDLGEKRISSRKDYDIDNDYEYEDLEIGDVDLLDYEDDLNSNLEDDIRDAIRESVDDNLPLDDGDTGGGYVDVDTEIDISVPVSGQVKFDWTSNENYYDENTDNEWNAETGQMCEVCFGKDDLPYNSDNFTECRRCGKSVCMDCEGEMQYHPDWFKVCGECSDVLDNVHDYGAEYLREKERVAGLDKEERYELYDENKLECDECGAVNKTVGYVEEGYKLCQPCDREMMAKQGYDAETVGSPSPSSPLEEVPATVPSPAEPTNENFGAESGQMCEVCFGNDDLPYDSDHFTECRRCGKSVCMDCDGEMQSHPDWFKVCGECSDVLDNVHDYGAESKNTKMVLGITALGIGLAFWKGKDLLSLWDRIKEKME